MYEFYATESTGSNVGDSPRIVVRYAGEGTADVTYVWSDGVEENVVGCGGSRRARYLMDRNTVTDPWAPNVIHIQLDPEPVPTVDLPLKSPPPPLRVRLRGLKAHKPKAPFFAARPEFHARSNPR